MGKLVKYCSSCEEGFAERFGFCPNCGGQLEAFEMNPIVNQAETMASSADNSAANSFVKAEEPAPQSFETSPKAETSLIPETMDFSDDDILELDSVDTREAAVEKEPETMAATVAAVSSNGNGFHSANLAESVNFSENYDDGEYHVTVVSEKASNWFAPFLLGLMAFAFVAFIGAYIAAIWFFGPAIPEVEGVNMTFYSNIAPDDPMELEEIKKLREDEGGGGGGGGKNNPDPASKGRLPNQTEKPLNPPMPLIVLQNPSLAVRNETQGNIKREQTDEPVGVPNSLSDKLSSGGGTGGGIGNGNGTGVGDGRGTGEGNGTGSGSGNGLGNGNGNNLGDGDGDKAMIKKIEKPVGVTQKYRIIDKPRASYTDAARQNNVQGTVTVKVTLLSSGQVGSVVPVKGLPYGLTEQAIAAAKRIRFEPSKENGVAKTVIATIQYSFTIY